MLWFDEIGAASGARVGGKAGSLGELRRTFEGRGIRIPNGFVTTAEAYDSFLETVVPAEALSVLEPADVRVLGPALDEFGEVTLREALGRLFELSASTDGEVVRRRSRVARELSLGTPMPPAVRFAIKDAYERLCASRGRPIDVAVRSSATKEDSATASFAGQYESFLNIRGVAAVLEAWKGCAASAFTERVVSYQLQRGLDPREGAVSVIVMEMVRSDLASSGVVFTLDPDSGNDNFVLVTSSWGLGEPIVQGSVSPDTFLLWKTGVEKGSNALIDHHKGEKRRKMVYAGDYGSTRMVDVEPEARDAWSLSSDEVRSLAEMAIRVERHYGRPMDIEWAKDGVSGELFLVQARPETVHAHGHSTLVREVYSMPRQVTNELRRNGSLRATGQAVGSRVACGKVRRYASYAELVEQQAAERRLLDEGVDPNDLDASRRAFDDGDVLVTEMTTPDWEPLMKKASLIVTEKGGRTSHAAIVAREFGIPAVVGCGDGARSLQPLEVVTGTCAEGDTGYVFAGEHPFDIQRIEVSESSLETAIKLNVGFPERALQDAMLPSDGVGLARLEFILTAEVGVHPLVLAHYADLTAFVESGEVAPGLESFGDRLRSLGRSGVGEILAEVDRRAPADEDKRALFVDRVKNGVARICAAFHPRPVLVRLSDLKSNEYRDLVGGQLFEPVEENPMIAWRGAARYADPRFRPAFDMECEALRSVCQDMGLDNLQVMVPFCRTPQEGRAVTELLEPYGLCPAHGVPLFLMVELPSNVLEAEEFIEAMGLCGGSIGTNDLVQTVYALSRDDMAGYGAGVDARSPAVAKMVRQAVETFRGRGLEIGICGQAPSDHPDEFPAFLVECGISSISVTPDTLLEVRQAVERAEVARAGARPRSWADRRAVLALGAD